MDLRNYAGETALVQAARAGHTKLVQSLIRHGADGSIINDLREGPLHFLTQFDDEDVAQVARDLGRCGASAHLQTVARGSSCGNHQSTRVSGGGTPAHRAVLAGSLSALKALFDLEDQLLSTGTAMPTTGQGMLRRLLAYAFKLHHVEIVKLLIERIDTPKSIPEVNIWDNGRLLNLRELAIRGTVSVNPACGFNWPERFARMMRFGRDYTSVLCDCLELLDQSCGILSWEKALEYGFLAISLGRRDVVPFLASRVLSGEPEPNPPEPNLPEDSSPDREDETGPSSSSSAAETSRNDTPNNEPLLEVEDQNELPFAGTIEPIRHIKNHALAWRVAILVHVAIGYGQRGILYDLLRFEDKVGLLPGNRERCAVSNEPCVYFEGSIDGRANFPPSAEPFRVRILGEQEKPAADETFVDGTMNYYLLYMHSISCSQVEDIALA